MHFVWQGH
jgi:hypothetical protein